MSFFDQVAIFPILTVYLSYLDQVLLPIAVMPFIYKNEAQKNISKTLMWIFGTIFMSETHVTHTKPGAHNFDYNAKFVTRGVQGDKTYF